MEGCGISVSWAGGKDGREVIDRFMPEVPRMLAPGGRLYLVCIKENFPEAPFSPLCGILAQF